MSISLLIEWLFTSLLVGALLLLIGQMAIRSYRLRHAFYQYAFILLLILPIASLIHRHEGGPSYSITKTSHRSVDTELITGFSIIPTPLPVQESSENLPKSISSSVAKPAQQAKTGITMRQVTFVLLAAYLLGVLTRFLRHYISLRLYCRKLPELRHSLPWLEAKVLISNDYSTPFCFGLVKPVIVLPEHMNDDREIRLSLLHENGHILNGDPQFSPIQYFVKALFFWNPLVWILNRKFNETQEIMADHHACQGVRDPQDYTRTILNLIRRSRSLKIPALTSGMASQKQQLLVRFNAMINERENMKLTHPILKKAGIGITTLLLYGAVLQTGLFAREEGGLTVKPLTHGVVADTLIADKDKADRPHKEMEIIAIASTRNAKTLILESLDGKVYTVLNSKESIDGGILRLGADVLYLQVTLEEANEEGGQVFLGPWTNGSPMTKEGKQLQKEFWPQIKAKKKELGHEQWLKFHGDKAAPPKR